MNKIILAIVFILLLDVVSAQEIAINLIEYHPDTYYTRLQVKNDAGKDLNDLILKIDDSFETTYDGIFKNGANYNLILNIPPGEHLVTVTTKEGVSSSKLVYFSLSKENVQEEIFREQEVIRREQELKQAAQKNLEEAQRQIEVEREKAVQLGIMKDSKTNMILIGGIIALIAGMLVIYWFIRGSKK